MKPLSFVQKNRVDLSSISEVRKPSRATAADLISSGWRIDLSLFVAKAHYRMRQIRYQSSKMFLYHKLGPVQFGDEYYWLFDWLWRLITEQSSELERTSAAAEAEERGRVGRRQSELGRGRLKHGQRSRSERTGRGGSRRHGRAQRQHEAVPVTTDRRPRPEPLRSVSDYNNIL